MPTVDLLIKRAPSAVPPGADGAKCWKLGDIIHWQKWPDDSTPPPWGRKELPEDLGFGNFFLVTVTDVPVNELTLQLRDWLNGEFELGDPEDPTTQLLVRLRRFRIHPNDVPAGPRQTLAQTGRLTVTWEQVRNFVTNRA